MARHAVQQIVDAKQLEDVLCHRSGWNRAGWSVWGGVYGGPERGGLEKEASDWGIDHGNVDAQGQENGGWTVDVGKSMKLLQRQAILSGFAVIDIRPEALTAAEGELGATASDFRAELP